MIFVEFSFLFVRKMCFFSCSFFGVHFFGAYVFEGVLLDVSFRECAATAFL